MLSDFDASLIVLESHYFTFDVVPQAKQSTSFGRGRAFTSPKKRAYVSLLRKLAQEQFQKPPLDGFVCLTIVFSFPWRKSDTKTTRALRWTLMDQTPDLDNIEKPLKDALQGVVYLNDSSVVSVRKRKIRSKLTGIFLRVDIVKPNYG